MHFGFRTTSKGFDPLQMLTIVYRNKLVLKNLFYINMALFLNPYIFLNDPFLTAY